MPPFQALMAATDEILTGSGYRSLSKIGSSLGIDRHGVWDFTWLAPEADNTEQVLAVYARARETSFFSLEVWRGEISTSSALRRRRVDRFDAWDSDDADRESDWRSGDRRLLDRIVSALDKPAVAPVAQRRDRPPADISAPAPAAIEPAYRGWRGAVLRVFERADGGPLRNRDVLDALVSEGWAEGGDGPLVGRALLTLERTGSLVRIARGVYALRQR